MDAMEPWVVHVGLVDTIDVVRFTLKEAFGRLGFKKFIPIESRFMRSWLRSMDESLFE